MHYLGYIFLFKKKIKRAKSIVKNCKLSYFEANWNIMTAELNGYFLIKPPLCKDSSANLVDKDINDKDTPHRYPYHLKYCSKFILKSLWNQSSLMLK